jgi:hypothetical protein
MEKAVVFEFDTTASYDGVNVKEYKAGTVYIATHPREKSVFQHYITTGRAKVVESVATEPTKSIKVVRPKAKKSK